MAKEMAVGRGGAVKGAGVGDGGDYLVTGNQAGLLVKKGDDSFKATVYATLPVDKKEAMEMTLAREVLAKL